MRSPKSGAPFCWKIILLLFMFFLSLLVPVPSNLTCPQWYSWVRLVSPYTEELISRPFVGENRFRLVRQTRIGPENAIGCIVFPLSLTFVFVSNSLVCSRGSRGTLIWICSKTANMDLSPVQFCISFVFHVSCLISAIILKTINDGDNVVVVAKI